MAAKGGARPGAGRKTDQERALIREREARKLSKIEAMGAQYEEEVWATICEKARGGDREAMRLFSDHQWGRPGQKKGGSQDPVINLWSSFRGVPYVCTRCREKTNGTEESDGPGIEAAPGEGAAGAERGPDAAAV